MLRITHPAHRKSYLVIIFPNSHDKLTNSEIRSSYYLLQFGFIYPYLATKYHCYPYLALVTYIWLYLGLITLIWAYLPLIALILPYVPYSPSYMHSAIETPPLCKIVEKSDHYVWRYCILKIWGIRVSSANAVWVVIQSLTIVIM